MKEVKIMNYHELKKLLCDHESSNPETHLTAYITFSSFGPTETRDLPWEYRTYMVSSDNKAFQPNMGGYSIFGSCLDGTDRCVRLENYMAEERGGKDGWVVEDCCILANVLTECSDLNISAPTMFYTEEDAEGHMLYQLAIKAGLDPEQMQKDYATGKCIFDDGKYGANSISAWLYHPRNSWRWEIKPAYIYGPLHIEIDDE